MGQGSLLNLTPTESRFPGRVGNTQKDPVFFTSPLDGVESKVFDRLPDATLVSPATGGDTTLVRSARTWKSGASAAGKTVGKEGAVS